MMTVIRVGLSLRTDVFVPTEVNYEEDFRHLPWNTQVHNLRPVVFTFEGYISQRILKESSSSASKHLTCINHTHINKPTFCVHRSFQIAANRHPNASHVSASFSCLSAFHTHLNTNKEDAPFPNAWLRLR